MNYVEERNESLSVSIHAITGYQRSEKQHSGSKFEEAVRVVEVQARSWWFSSSTAAFFRKARVTCASRRQARCAFCRDEQQVGQQVRDVCVSVRVRCRLTCVVDNSPW